MSLLSTIQRAATLAGYTRPGAAAQAPDSAIAQMVELARQDAEELAARIDWSALVRQHVFTTTAGYNQTNGLPTDYGRMTFGGRIRQNNRLWTLDGPTSNDDWDRMIDFPQIAYPSNWRIFGGALQLLPAPAAGETVRFDYVSSNLYKAAGGTLKATWDADTDVCVLPESVISLGVVWRWRALKGLEYGEHMMNAEAAIQRAAGSDGGGKPVLTARRRTRHWGDFAYPGVLGPH